MKGQVSTGRFGYALSAPGEGDRKGKGTYTTDLDTVIRRLVFDGWNVRAKTAGASGRRREGSFGIGKRSIVGYEISDDLKHIVDGADHRPIRINTRPGSTHTKSIKQSDSISVTDEKTLREIMSRRGQADFRQGLIQKFNGKCCITGCQVEAVLEAAHIISHASEPSYDTANGLLLRADIHTLFALDLLGIDGTGAVRIHPTLRGSSYETYVGHKISETIEPALKGNLSRKFAVFASLAGDG
jgi:hypothetical protein